MSSYAQSEPVMVYFEDNAGRASTAFGPFESFHITEGMARTELHPVARFDNTQLLWYPSGTQDGGASLLITPRAVARLDLPPFATARTAAPSPSHGDTDP